MPVAGGGLDDDAAAEVFQHFGTDRREDRTEQPADLRGGDEIARGAELAAAGTVVAQPRRIQREVHVLGEIDPAASGSDTRLDVRAQPLAVSKRIGTGRREVGGLYHGVILAPVHRLPPGAAPGTQTR